MIQGLWYRQAESIIDIKLGDTDVNSYKYEPMAELLDWWETIKKGKHGKNCHDQQKYFPLFVLFINGTIGIKALVVLSNCS